MSIEIDGKKVKIGELVCDICHEPLSMEGNIGQSILSNVTMIPEGNFHTSCYKEMKK
ncbi:MAG: hypothetical protein ACW99F_14390 [Candidatus Hodarchaeales archaeon]|jgi:hypothetical protein